MEKVINHIVCDDCCADFEIKFDEDEKEPAYCPFCGADLFWDEEDESEESDIYLEWSDPNDDEYE